MQQLKETEFKAYERIINSRYDFIAKHQRKEEFSGYPSEIERYLCPCGVVDIIKDKDPSKDVLIKSQVCGFDKI